jgi:hypothetical protein
MSVDCQDHSLWDAVLAINTLRNKIAHSIDSPEREKAVKKFFEVYWSACGGKQDEDKEPHLALLLAQAHCLGFINSFKSEVERFREIVDAMNLILNVPKPEDAG